MISSVVQKALYCCLDFFQIKRPSDVVLHCRQGVALAGSAFADAPLRAVVLVRGLRRASTVDS